MDLYSEFERDFVESVRCRVVDDGSFHRGLSGTFTQWVPIDTTLRLGVGRAKVSEAVLPHDNSEVGMVGVYWVFGLAYSGL